MNRLFICFLTFCLLAFPNLSEAQDSDWDDDKLEMTYLNYGAKAIGSTDDFRAFVVGSAVTAETLKDDLVTKELKRINELADVVIVGSENLKAPLANLTGLKVYVTEKHFDELATEVGSAKYWVLIWKKDNELHRFVSSRDLPRMIAGTKKVENRLKKSAEQDD